MAAVDSQTKSVEELTERLRRLQGLAVLGTALPFGFWDDLTEFLREDAPELARRAALCDRGEKV